jgi:hypothetical protein
MTSEDIDRLSVRPDEPQGGEEVHWAENVPERNLSDLTAAQTEKIDMTSLLEGGARAWCVAIGSAGVLFFTLGYVNAFG